MANPGLKQDAQVAVHQQGRQAPQDLQRAAQEVVVVVVDEQVRVKFGARDNQEIPLAWAERMLTDLAASRPKMFGDLLAKAALNGDK